jgi:enoyl-CoA hydratase/carnithine racemase
MAAYDTLELTVDGAIAHLWLNRPAALNALSPRALDEIADVFTALQTRFDVQVVVLGGRGRAFCAGADRKDPPARLTRASGAGPRERRWVSQIGRRAVEAVERCEAITVARLHGHVVGGGVVLALACDLRVAAAGTRFHVPEVDLGIPLTWGAVPRLAREVGAARAREIVLLCDAFDAAQAAAWNVVHRVVAPDALDATVAELAARLAAKAPWALHMTKHQFQAYAKASVLGDVTTMDGDLLTAASAEDPMRFAWTPEKR